MAENQFQWTFVIMYKCFVFVSWSLHNSRLAVVSVLFLILINSRALSLEFDRESDNSVGIMHRQYINMHHE